MKRLSLKGREKGFAAFPHLLRRAWRSASTTWLTFLTNSDGFTGRPEDDVLLNSDDGGDLPRGLGFRCRDCPRLPPPPLLFPLPLLPLSAKTGQQLKGGETARKKREVLVLVPEPGRKKVETPRANSLWHSAGGMTA
eukprot:scaffold48098_cov25-Prasinocladus_malaysianus.AAC.1